MALDADDGLVLGEVLFFFFFLVQRGVGEREKEGVGKRGEVVVEERAMLLRPSKKLFFSPSSFDGACSLRQLPLVFVSSAGMTPSKYGVRIN